jgi:hypothetical protein
MMVAQCILPLVCCSVSQHQRINNVYVFVIPNLFLSNKVLSLFLLTYNHYLRLFSVVYGCSTLTLKLGMVQSILSLANLSEAQLRGEDSADNTLILPSFIFSVVVIWLCRSDGVSS